MSEQTTADRLYEAHRQTLPPDNECPPWHEAAWALKVLWQVVAEERREDQEQHNAQ